MKTVGLFTLFQIILSMISISILSLVMVSSAEAAHKHGKNLKGRSIPIPDNPLTPPTQDPITSHSRNRIASGLQLPKNLIIPTCSGGGATSVSTGTTSCPPVIGTNRADIIIATE